MVKFRASFLALLLIVVLSASPSSGEDVYLYDQGISNQIDVATYTTTGEVIFARGAGGVANTVEPGPAPPPYPQIHVWENGYEYLGESRVEMDGIRFINVGRHWVKNRQALVQWTLVIPNASSRMASEFEQDITLSMWVDWDQNEIWAKGEKVILEHINIQDQFPTTEDELRISYLTGFRVPDINDLMSSQAWWKNKDLRFLWVRGTVAYDDPDASPDGEQLFGEVEDYRVAYMMVPAKVGLKE